MKTNSDSTIKAYTMGGIAVGNSLKRGGIYIVNGRKLMVR